MDNLRENLLRARSWSRDLEDAPPEDQSEELRALHQKNKQFNQQVRAELRAIPVPHDLRDRILAGRKIVHVPFWQKPAAWLAAAAALVLIGSLTFLAVRPREDVSIAGFRSRMVGFALREYRMDILTSDFTSLKTFLSSKQVPSEFTVPTQLAAKPLKGGASLTWQGKPVAMVCFDAGAGKTLYMFVLAGAQAAPSEVTTVKGLATATWANAGNVFVLAGEMNPDSLAELVRS